MAEALEQVATTLVPGVPGICRRHFEAPPT